MVRYVLCNSVVPLQRGGENDLRSEIQNYIESNLKDELNHNNNKNIAKTMYKHILDIHNNHNSDKLPLSHILSIILSNINNNSIMKTQQNGGGNENSSNIKIFFIVSILYLLHNLFTNENNILPNIVNEETMADEQILQLFPDLLKRL